MCYHCAFSKHIDIVQDLRIKIFTDLWQWHLTPFLHVLNDKTPQMHIWLYPHLATRLCACHQPEWRHLSHKHPGPNNIPRCVLTDCRDTDIFTNSSQIVTTTITPVLKTASQSCFNEYHPIALTPIIMMCFEMLCYVINEYIKSIFTPSLECNQFVNQSNTNSISFAFHLAFRTQQTFMW